MAFAVVATNAFQLAFLFGTSIDKVRTDMDEASASFGAAPLGPAQLGAVALFQVLSCRSAGFQVIDIKRRASPRAALGRAVKRSF